ncbi:MAG: glycoside hydrolase family 3 protein [Desulfovibrionaceae bacterium]|nr:glycoside hydrolase family 3 protein [Desulfovibrionaceae bacterium]
MDKPLVPVLLSALLGLVLVVGCGARRGAWGPVADPELKLMAGQLVMVGFRGLVAEADGPLAEALGQGLGGLILFDRDVALNSPERNIKSPGQVRALISGLQARAKVPLFVAVDQEGGRVQRLRAGRGFLETPSARALGRSGDPLALGASALIIGNELAENGFNLDFAPVVDLDLNPESPAIGALERSFSPDPEKVARMAAEFVSLLGECGVIACPKHFPGHGSARTDSHLGLTDVTRTWSGSELVPYRRLIDAGLCDMVMAGHVFNAELDPKYPASLSRATITGLLRQALGFDGLVVTDDLDMKAVAGRYGFKETIFLALDAGADILLFGNNLSYDPDIAARAVRAITELVAEGRLDRSRIEESFQRIMALKAKAGLVPRAKAD